MWWHKLVFPTLRDRGKEDQEFLAAWTIYRERDPPYLPPKVPRTFPMEIFNSIQYSFFNR